jgi:hypothetical protein
MAGSDHQLLPRELQVGGEEGEVEGGEELELRSRRRRRGMRGGISGDTAPSKVPTD